MRPVFLWVFPDHGGKSQGYFILTLHSDTILKCFLLLGL